jgi:hypothetical protein
MAVTLGKDVTISGVSNARSVTADATANEIDVTTFGDTERRFRKSHIELTVEVECVDDPGVDVGDTFTLSGPTVGGSKTFIVTAVTENQPLDDIITYTVSGSNTAS